MKRSIAVAVSGGVDSMIAAHILKQDHPNVFGLHFLTGFEITPADQNARSAAIHRRPTGHPGARGGCERRLQSPRGGLFFRHLSRR